VSSARAQNPAISNGVVKRFEQNEPLVLNLLHRFFMHITEANTLSRFELLWTNLQPPGNTT
jgi:hypothetical protein